MVAMPTSKQRTKEANACSGSDTPSSASPRISSQRTFVPGGSASMADSISAHRPSSWLG
jgi:hypothetical protein